MQAKTQWRRLLWCIAIALLSAFGCQEQCAPLPVKEAQRERPPNDARTTKERTPRDIAPDASEPTASEHLEHPIERAHPPEKRRPPDLPPAREPRISTTLHQRHRLRFSHTGAYPGSCATRDTYSWYKLPPRPPWPPQIPSGPRRKGEACTIPTGTQKDNCAPGLRCRTFRLFHSTYYIQYDACVVRCQADRDCDAGAGEICTSPLPQPHDARTGQSNTAQERLFCAYQKREGQLCTPLAGQTCTMGKQALPNGLSLLCVTAPPSSDVGTCRRTCRTDKDCKDAPGKQCRSLSHDTPGQLRFCLPKQRPGPHCADEPCDPQNPNKGCRNGLSCIENKCTKQCTRSNENKTCNTNAGEICHIHTGNLLGHCIKPSDIVQEPGKRCSLRRPCATNKGLFCQEVADGAICVKRCAPANPDCPSQHKCLPQGSETIKGLYTCRKIARREQPCTSADVCANNTDRCIDNISKMPASCLPLCNLSTKTTSCYGGKGRRRPLLQQITIDGTTYNGACLPPRPATREVGERCEMTVANGGFASPDCIKGAGCFYEKLDQTWRCMQRCDPNKQVERGVDQWFATDCPGKQDRCISLSHRSDHCSWGDVCTGPPSRKLGEQCGLRYACKEGACVTFHSSVPPHCEPRCDPSKGARQNPDCPGNAACGGLRCGGGVCVPQRKLMRPLHASCLGFDHRQENYHDCKPKDDKGRPMSCFRSSYENLGRCLLTCETTKGTACQDVGIPSPTCTAREGIPLGHCVEACDLQTPYAQQCKATSCKIGQCQYLPNGKTGCY